MSRLCADCLDGMTIMEDFCNDGGHRSKIFYGMPKKKVKSYRDTNDSCLLVDVNYLLSE